VAALLAVSSVVIGAASAVPDRWLYSVTREVGILNFAWAAGSFRRVNKVRVGFFSFTEITDPSEHRAYNEWHMLDHMPEQFPLDGVAYGQRWVAAPACAAARAVNESPFDAVHYVTLYLMTEPVDRTLREFFELGGDLRARGRFHQHRRSHLSGPFRFLDAGAAPRVLVSPEAVPYRPHRGIYIVVEETRDRAGLDPYAAWLHAEHHPSLLAVPGVAGLWTFATSARYREGPWDPGDRRVTVCWLDDDPLAVAARIDAVEEARREFDAVSHVTLAGPFETIVAGEWDWFASIQHADPRP